MYTLQIRHGYLSVVQVFILFLNRSSEFPFLKLSGAKSHIFGASEERPSLPKYTEFIFIRFIIDWLPRLQFLTLKENNSFNISGEIICFAGNNLLFFFFLYSFYKNCDVTKELTRNLRFEVSTYLKILVGCFFKKVKRTSISFITIYQEKLIKARRLLLRDEVFIQQVSLHRHNFLYNSSIIRITAISQRNNSETIGRTFCCYSISEECFYENQIQVAV